MSPRVMGYVMARDEWPALGLSVAHALKMGVDMVVVADHQSTDRTREGVETLMRAWPGRIAMHRIETDLYLQEATTALMMAESCATSFDWLYVFDADEFGLLSDGLTFGDLLARVPESVDAIRYELNNWVAPHDLDDQELNGYGGLRHRACPSQFVTLPPETIRDEIENGHSNLFDLPLQSKVIARSRWAHAIAAGAHRVQSSMEIREIPLDPGVFRAAHIPYRSKSALMRKCEHGKVLLASGFPERHGWQSQMLVHLQAAGKIDDFWRTHSIAALGEESTGCPPLTEVDDSLASALLRVIPELRDALASGMQTGPPEPLMSSDVLAQSRGVAVGVIHRTLSERNGLAHDREALAREHSAAVAERHAVVSHLQAELEVVIHQRDNARRRLRAIERSRTFRLGRALTLPLRVLRRVQAGRGTGQ